MEAHSPLVAHSMMADAAESEPDVHRLAAQYGRDVFKAAFRVTGNRVAAEDVQQNVFVRLIEHPPRVRVASWKAYLCAAAMRSAIDELRRDQRWRRLTEALLFSQASTDPQPHAALEDQARALHLRKALGRIPRRQAECFALRFLEGLELEEIASALSVTNNVVSVSLNRATKSLRKSIARIESSPSEVQS